ncbi:MAG TPA: inorganic phosphate transporter [Streptosporangiaceae bacterium]|nr:inorganic phosphate transporter [Streptosporangiaceae bacterium]
MTIAIFVLLVALAAANGANDVSKGIATLAGAGVTRYRTAIAWGATATLLGGILSIVTGHAMGKLFSSGIIGGQPVASFALAVLVGTMTWVALASVFRLPVSTTHALVGSLIGAGLLFAPDAIHWASLLTKVVTPLLVSIVVAYAVSALLGIVLQRSRAGRSARTAPALPDAEPAGRTLADGVTASGHGHPAAVLNQVRLETETATEAKNATAGNRIIAGLHWLSSGATCIARALNDTPKIAAVGAFALIPAGMTADQITLTVAAAMGLGSLLGIRVAKTLGERVVHMDHLEGFRANAITAFLVGVGAQAGWPMSTTHVSTGAITGIPGANLSRLNGKILRDFVLAWTVTPVFGGLVAAGAYFIAR